MLQHRPLPLDSHLKEWKPIHKDGLLWLCLVVEVQRPLPPPIQAPASTELRLEWTPMEHGIRFGTMHESVTNTVCDLTIDLQESPKEPKERAPFRIDFGPTRWEKRNMDMLVPDWKPGEALLNVFAIRTSRETCRAGRRQATKDQLRTHLHGILPPEVQSAGFSGLQMFAKDNADDPSIQEIFTAWAKEDDAIGRVLSMYRTRSTRRIEDGHAHVAHDICRYLEERQIHRLLTEPAIPQRSTQLKEEAFMALQYSSKFNDFAAVGKFLLMLKGTAAKCGILIEEQKGIASFKLSRLGQDSSHELLRSSVGNWSSQSSASDGCNNWGISLRSVVIF